MLIFVAAAKLPVTSCSFSSSSSEVFKDNCFCHNKKNTDWLHNTKNNQKALD